MNLSPKFDASAASAGYRMETAKALLLKVGIEATGEPTEKTRVIGVRGGELEPVA